MLGRVEADGLKRAEVEVLGVHGAGLQDDLELVVVLHAVGVLAVATVRGAATRLRVARTPGVGTQAAQGRCRVEGSGANLGVIGLHDRAALICPVVLEGKNHVLEREGVFLHASPTFLPQGHVPCARNVQTVLDGTSILERPKDEQGLRGDARDGNGAKVA